MSSRVDPSKVPKSFHAKGATHKRGELRRSVKPASSSGRSIRQCEVQSRFIGDSAINGSWTGTTAFYAEKYLAREAAGIDGEQPEFFTVDKDGNVIPADHREFIRDAEADRYMIELVIPPNDGDKIRDMNGFVAAVISKMEDDLGTKLQWVAVVHEKHDAAHPEPGPKNKHSHVLIRGVDDREHTLWVSREYLASTLRDVMQKELSAYPTNEREKGWRLGPMSEDEQAAFQRQMAANRPNRIEHGWTKPNEQELRQMQREKTLTATMERDETTGRKRDRTRGAGMGEE